MDAQNTSTVTEAYCFVKTPEPMRKQAAQSPIQCGDGCAHGDRPPEKLRSRVSMSCAPFDNNLRMMHRGIKKFWSYPFWTINVLCRDNPPFSF